MKNIRSVIVSLTVLFAVSTTAAKADDFNTGRPRLLLTEEGVKEIKAALGTIPSFDASVAAIKESADNAVAGEIVVPIPADGGGGYSHEQHKQNYYSMYHSGIMYQLTGETKYAEYVKTMLMEYADMYPTLPAHPKGSGTPGRLFWQTLNEYVWLVHTANAYDCIYTYLSDEQTAHLEKNLFYPMAEYFMGGTPNHNRTFNNMSNHGTWSISAVGLIGYVMGDSDLVDKALYGSDKKGNRTGFISQLDILFSPEGYYTEGAYYQRYAIWPFVVFGQVIDHNQPELGIYEHRDGVLKKATRTVIDLTYNRYLFMLNDAVEKNLDAQEIVNAVNATYKSDPSDKQLLSISEGQHKFVVSDAGLATARAIEAGEAEPYVFKSRLLTDGPEGKDGGIAIIRASEEYNALTLVMKATSHGLGHGHYDKLSFTLYDNGNEIMPEYGSVRFLNIEPKHGGGYTPENTSYSDQTASHNTIIVDETSHFNGDIALATPHAPLINFFSSEGTGNQEGVQIVSSTIDTAYEGIAMRRTMAVVETGAEPLIIDIFRVESEDEHTYDLPFYHRGHIISSNFEITRDPYKLEPLGTKAGYQHLWVNGVGEPSQQSSELGTFTWVLGNRFYSVNTLSDASTKYYQVLAGAGDPNNNLRNEKAMFVRKEGTSKSFISTIEPHGLYDLVMEVTSGFTSNVAGLETLVDNADYTIVKVTMVSGAEYTLCVQNAGSEATEDAKNVVKADNGQEFSWTGDYALFTK